MCLTKNKAYHPHNRPLKAKEDIVCYKALISTYVPNLFRTPIMETELNVKFYMEFQIPYKAKKDNSFLFFTQHILGMGSVASDGFIHTLSSSCTCPGYAVFKCIIPKGTKYFIGNDGDYASEQIVFIEQLK